MELNDANGEVKLLSVEKRKQALEIANVREKQNKPKQKKSEYTIYIYMAMEVETHNIKNV